MKDNAYDDNLNKTNDKIKKEIDVNKSSIHYNNLQSKSKLPQTINNQNAVISAFSEEKPMFKDNKNTLNNLGIMVQTKKDKEKKQKGNYILGKTLGEGAFGKVKLATHVFTQQQVAIKILDKTKMIEEEDDIVRVQKEISILKKLKHKNIIHLYEIMESKKNLYLVMEYCENKELFDYIVKHQRVSENDANRFFQEILDGVEYLHSLRIVHRDLKPENLLLDCSLRIKISDFGLSTSYKGTLSTPCGTPSYAPPEMLRGDNYSGVKSDIWSMGVILYVMLCGALPFQESKEDLILKKIENKELIIPEDLSFLAKDLIMKILNEDPFKRLSIKQIRSHPWFLIGIPSPNYCFYLGYHQIPIDEEVLSMVVKYGLNREEVIQHLKKNKFDSLTAIYYLCLKRLCQGKKESVSDFVSNAFFGYLKSNDNVEDEQRDSSLAKFLEFEKEEELYEEYMDELNIYYENERKAIEEKEALKKEEEPRTIDNNNEIENTIEEDEAVNGKTPGIKQKEDKRETTTQHKKSINEQDEEDDETKMRNLSQQLLNGLMESSKNMKGKNVCIDKLDDPNFPSPNKGNEEDESKNLLIHLSLKNTNSKNPSEVASKEKESIVVDSNITQSNPKQVIPTIKTSKKNIVNKLVTKIKTDYKADEKNNYNSNETEKKLNRNEKFIDVSKKGGNTVIKEQIKEKFAIKESLFPNAKGNNDNNNINNNKPNPSKENLLIYMNNKTKEKVLEQEKMNISKLNNKEENSKEKKVKIINAKPAINNSNFKSSPGNSNANQSSSSQAVKSVMNIAQNLTSKLTSNTNIQITFSNNLNNQNNNTTTTTSTSISNNINTNTITSSNLNAQIINSNTKGNKVNKPYKSKIQDKPSSLSNIVNIKPPSNRDSEKNSTNNLITSNYSSNGPKSLSSEIGSSEKSGLYKSNGFQNFTSNSNNNNNINHYLNIQLKNSMISGTSKHNKVFSNLNTNSTGTSINQINKSNSKLVNQIISGLNTKNKLVHNKIIDNNENSQNTTANLNSNSKLESANNANISNNNANESNLIKLQKKPVMNNSNNNSKKGSKEIAFANANTNSQNPITTNTANTIMNQSNNIKSKKAKQKAFNTFNKPNSIALERSINTKTGLGVLTTNAKHIPKNSNIGPETCKNLVLKYIANKLAINTLNNTNPETETSNSQRKDSSNVLENFDLINSLYENLNMELNESFISVASSNTKEKSNVNNVSINDQGIEDNAVNTDKSKFIQAESKSKLLRKRNFQSKPEEDFSDVINILNKKFQSFFEANKSQIDSNDLLNDDLLTSFDDSKGKLNTANNNNNNTLNTTGNTNNTTLVTINNSNNNINLNNQLTNIISNSNQTNNVKQGKNFSSKIKNNINQVTWNTSVQKDASANNNINNNNNNNNNNNASKAPVTLIRQKKGKFSTHNNNQNHIKNFQEKPYESKKHQQQGSSKINSNASNKNNIDNQNLINNAFSRKEVINCTNPMYIEKDADYRYESSVERSSSNNRVIARNYSFSPNNNNFKFEKKVNWCKKSIINILPNNSTKDISNELNIENKDSSESINTNNQSSNQNISLNSNLNSSLLNKPARLNCSPQVKNNSNSSYFAGTSKEFRNKNYEVISEDEEIYQNTITNQTNSEFALKEKNFKMTPNFFKGKVSSNNTNESNQKAILNSGNASAITTSLNATKLNPTSNLNMNKYINSASLKQKRNNEGKDSNNVTITSNLDDLTKSSNNNTNESLNNKTFLIKDVYDKTQSNSNYNYINLNDVGQCNDQSQLIATIGVDDSNRSNFSFHNNEFNASQNSINSSCNNSKLQANQVKRIKDIKLGIIQNQNTKDSGLNSKLEKRHRKTSSANDIYKSVSFIKKGNEYLQDFKSRIHEKAELNETTQYFESKNNNNISAAVVVNNSNNQQGKPKQGNSNLKNLYTQTPIKIPSFNKPQQFSDEFKPKNIDIITKFINQKNKMRIKSKFANSINFNTNLSSNQNPNNSNTGNLIANSNNIMFINNNAQLQFNLNSYSSTNNNLSISNASSNLTSNIPNNNKLNKWSGSINNLPVNSITTTQVGDTNNSIFTYVSNYVALEKLRFIYGPVCPKCIFEFDKKIVDKLLYLIKRMNISVTYNPDRSVIRCQLDFNLLKTGSILTSNPNSEMKSLLITTQNYENSIGQVNYSSFSSYGFLDKPQVFFIEVCQTIGKLIYLNLTLDDSQLSNNIIKRSICSIFQIIITKYKIINL